MAQLNCVSGWIGSSMLLLKWCQRQIVHQVLNIRRWRESKALSPLMTAQLSEPCFDGSECHRKEVVSSDAKVTIIWPFMIAGTLWAIRCSHQSGGGSKDAHSLREILRSRVTSTDGGRGSTLASRMWKCMMDSSKGMGVFTHLHLWSFLLVSDLVSAERRAKALLNKATVNALGDCVFQMTYSPNFVSFLRVVYVIF